MVTGNFPRMAMPERNRAMSGKSKTRAMPKSAITGRIVTAGYAASHPKTTVVQRVPVSTPKKGK